MSKPGYYVTYHTPGGVSEQVDIRNMTINVQCDCGKRLRARDSLAGRRVKCPQCASPVTVPGKSLAPPSVASEPVMAQAVVPPDQLPATCHCGRNTTVARHHRTDVVFCEACGSVLTIHDDHRSHEVHGREPTFDSMQMVTLRPIPKWVARNERSWRGQTRRRMIVSALLLLLPPVMIFAACLGMILNNFFWFGLLFICAGVFFLGLAAMNFYSLQFVLARRQARDRAALQSLRAEQ